VAHRGGGMGAAFPQGVARTAQTDRGNWDNFAKIIFCGKSPRPGQPETVARVLSKRRAPPWRSHPKARSSTGIGMSRKQATILIDGEPTRPLQETVPCRPRDLATSTGTISTISCGTVRRGRPSSWSQSKPNQRFSRRLGVGQGHTATAPMMRGCVRLQSDGYDVEPRPHAR
jgi:hypothetical protein